MMRSLAARSTHLGAGHVRGALYAIDWFPGMTDGVDDVAGDLLRLPDEDGMLAELDAYEGADYARRRTTVRMKGGEEIEAWTYMWVGALDGATRIESGDFLAHTQSVA